MEVEAEGEGGQGKHGEDTVVEGEDSQGSACVELAEEAGTGKGIVEDSRDEEAGEDEEEVDADCTKGKRIVDDRFEGRMGAGRE